MSLPTTSVGNWSDEPCVLSLQTRLKLIVRPPANLADPGNSLDADEIDEALRWELAANIHNLTTRGFAVVGVVIESFQEAGA